MNAQPGSNIYISDPDFKFESYDLLTIGCDGATLIDEAIKKPQVFISGGIEMLINLYGVRQIDR
jgi:hypothetical protein